MSNETQTQEQGKDLQVQDQNMFSSLNVYQDYWKMASNLAKSDMIPKEYQRKPENVIIAIEMSQRMGASVFAIMQGMDVIHGRPSWRSQFIISAINTCGRFHPLQYKFFGTEGKDDWGCYAFTKERKTGQVLSGPRVTIKMAKDEGWYQKNGSKWQTMPELMLHYRAAAFFGRLYAPDVLNGMYTVEETLDTIDVEVSESPQPAKEDLVQGTADSVKEKLKSMKAEKKTEPEIPAEDVSQIKEEEPKKQTKGFLFEDEEIPKSDVNGNG